MLDGVPITGLTAPALLGIAVMMLLLGRIVPRSTFDEKAKEAEHWRLAYEKEREARATSDAQTVELLELAKTTHNLMVAVFGAPGISPGLLQRAGGASVVPTKE
jgi:hypothetical protein